jgi:hypothetical protein
MASPTQRFPHLIHGCPSLSPTTTDTPTPTPSHQPRTNRYIILEAVPDNYLVVGYPDRSYLWIMARTSTLSDELYAQIEERCVTEWG